jgi:hypothetical protein
VDSVDNVRMTVCRRAFYSRRRVTGLVTALTTWQRGRRRITRIFRTRVKRQDSSQESRLESSQATILLFSCFFQLLACHNIVYNRFTISKLSRFFFFFFFFSTSPPRHGHHATRRITPDSASVMAFRHDSAAQDRARVICKLGIIPNNCSSNLSKKHTSKLSFLLQHGLNYLFDICFLCVGYLLLLYFCFFFRAVGLGFTPKI